MVSLYKSWIWWWILDSLLLCCYTRGAHFKKIFVRLSWPIDILYNFSWGFQIYNFFQDWTHPINAQLLPTQPKYPRLQATWAELVCRLGVSNHEKNCIFRILMKNCTKYESAIKICDVAGTPTVIPFLKTNALFSCLIMNYPINICDLPSCRVSKKGFTYNICRINKSYTSLSKC